MHGTVKKFAKWQGFLWILPSFLGVMVFYLLPYADVVRRSFLGAVDNRFVGLANYRTIMENPAFLLAVKNTLRFTALCIPLLILLALACAVILYRSKYGGFIKSAFLMPMALPAVSVALVWRLLFHSQGLLNHWLSQFKASEQDWMNTSSAFWILVISYIWKNLGYDIVLWMAGLAGISENIYEAAKVDGAGEWQCFWKITLPNLKPSLYTITVLSFLNSFKIFREAYLVAGDYPHETPRQSPSSSFPMKEPETRKNTGYRAAAASRANTPQRTAFPKWAFFRFKIFKSNTFSSIFVSTIPGFLQQ